MERSLNIVVSGAESTGKSTLAEALSSHFLSPWIPEFSRSYVENLPGHYAFSDVEIIARKQIEQQLEAEKRGGIIFFDTWLIITKVWFDVVYGCCPEWVEEHIRKSRIDLFLVCDIDIPWIADGVRENGGENRERLHKTYIQQIERFDFPYRIISGSGNERTANAIEIVNSLMVNGVEK